MTCGGDRGGRGSRWRRPWAEAAHVLGGEEQFLSGGGAMMTHKYMGSIIVLLISKSVKPNEEQKELISGFQQGFHCM